MKKPRKKRFWGSEIWFFGVTKSLSKTHQLTNYVEDSSKIRHFPSLRREERDRWALKKKTWLVRLYRGLYYPIIFRDYFINHDIRIFLLTNQDSMESNTLPKFNISPWCLAYLSRWFSELPQVGYVFFFLEGKSFFRGSGIFLTILKSKPISKPWM